MLEISRWTMLHGRADQLKLTAIKSTVTENNQHYTTWEIADIIKISKLSAENHLYQLGYVNHFDVWFPHKLSEKNLLDHISACDFLLKHNENVPFLKQIVTGDEKWILYKNADGRDREASETNHPYHTKGRFHPKKVILCIWWDWKGALYYELFLENQTIHSNKYCSQLDQLKPALDEKRPELVNRKCIIFHQDNADHMFL